MIKGGVISTEFKTRTVSFDSENLTIKIWIVAAAPRKIMNPKLSAMSIKATLLRSAKNRLLIFLDLVMLETFALLLNIQILR